MSRVKRHARVVGKGVILLFAIVGVVLSIRDLTAQSKTPFSNFQVSHVGIIVRDMNQTIQNFKDVFGIEIPQPTEFGPLTYGENPPPGLENSKLKLVTFKLGDLGIELIEPVRGPGPQKEFLDKFGQNLQHIAIRVPDQMAAVNFLRARGGKWSLRSYVDMKEQMGFTFEVQQAPPAK